MKKKKIRRVDGGSNWADQMALHWQSFQSSGALPASAMMLGYVMLAALLLSLRLATGPEGAGRVEVHFFWAYLGILFFVTFVLAVNVTQFEPSLLSNHYATAALLVTLLLMLGLMQLGRLQDWWSQLLTVPVFMGAVITTIAYTRRLALVVGGYLALIGIFMLRDRMAFDEGFSLFLVLCCGMTVTVMALRQVRSRSTLIQVCGLGGVVLFVLTWLYGSLINMPAEDLWPQSLTCLCGALGVGFFVQGILQVIEVVFHTATAMRLLDYSDANKPLLQRLAVEAPGTFHHSMQIGMLAEAAAEAIGANGLLCRVGSYYHDIGKLNKPHFFVENQGEAYSHHKDLSPTMSKMIIIGHVKDGLEMAQEYKLPKILHHFIATHHGTTLVEYFFHEASKNEGENGRSGVSESDFRYPGPKPQSKEMAIVMLCDAVEGATRAMAEPTPSRIEGLVDKILMKRLLDGQFDECNITLKELRTIEARVVSTLCGMYHGRIAYPSSANAKEKDAKKNESRKATEPEPQAAGAPTRSS